MKIAIIGNANSIHIIKFVNELIKRGNEVTLFTLKVHENNHNQIDKKCKIHYLKGKVPFAYYINAVKLKIMLSKGKFDIINAHYASGYGTLARLANAKPLVLNVWGSDVYDFPYESKLKHKILIKNLLYASEIASTSASMAEHTKNLLSKYKNKEIYITPFGVDINKFCLKKDESVKGKKVVRIGIIKSLSEKYGIQYLIKAFKILSEKYNSDTFSLELKIYGVGEDEDKLKKLVNDLNLNKEIMFEGYILNDKVPKVLADLDIFVQSSILDSESFGVSTVEAMAVGVPVVATDVSGSKEVIVDGVTGIIVPREDSEALSVAIMSLIEDDEKRTTMGLNGRMRVEKLYSLHNNVETLLSVYKEAIRKGV